MFTIAMAKEYKNIGANLNHLPQVPERHLHCLCKRMIHHSLPSLSEPGCIEFRAKAGEG
jgi:hypothetical protein